MGPLAMQGIPGSSSPEAGGGGRSTGWGLFLRPGAPGLHLRTSVWGFSAGWGSGQSRAGAQAWLLATTTTPLRPKPSHPGHLVVLRTAALGTRLHPHKVWSFPASPPGPGHPLSPSFHPTPAPGLPETTLEASRPWGGGRGGGVTSPSRATGGQKCVFRMEPRGPAWGGRGCAWPHPRPPSPRSRLTLGVGPAVPPGLLAQAGL